MKRCPAILFSFILFLGMCQIVWAHPHSFIDLKTDIISDEKNITAVAMRWTLDTMTSSNFLYDLMGKNEDDLEWQKQANAMMDNIIENHYFSEIYRNDVKIVLDDNITAYKMSRNGLQIIFSFTVNFQQAQPIANSHYQLITFEPTFFVDMTYPYSSDIVLSPAMGEHKCTVSLVTPEPDADIQAYALALDNEDTPIMDINLGWQFAQKVSVICP